MTVRRLDEGTEVEPCPVCDEETPHEVRIEIRTENPRSDHAKFSREPYRVAECQRCGKETLQRMNDA